MRRRVLDDKESRRQILRELSGSGTGVASGGEEPTALSFGLHVGHITFEVRTRDCGNAIGHP